MQELYDDFTFEKSSVIWENSKAKNRWMCFKKQVSLNILPDSALARISVDTKYWLYINEILVVFEGGLNRNMDPVYGYYDEVDISSFLKPGDNTISVLVWYWGNGGRNSADSGQGGLLFDCSSIDLYSDESWSMMIHPAYRETDEPHPSYLYGGHNIGYDAEKEIVGWQSGEITNGAWKNPTVIGKPEDIGWGKLHLRSIPNLRFTPVKPYQKTEIKNGVVHATLPYAAHVTPYFKIKTNEAQKVHIRTDRYEVPGGPNDLENHYNSHRTEYYTKAGINEFESLDWVFAEEILYTFPEDVQILELGYRESGYDTNFVEPFICNDESLNLLLEKCRRTLYICMRDNFMDCPDRERGQWIGDVSVQLPQTFYSLNRNADKLSRKAISDFIQFRKNDVLVGNVPGIHSLELPSQSLNAISEMGLIMQYYQYSGDKSCVFEAYPAAKKYLLLWEMSDNGLVAHREGGWHWYDHLENVDDIILENCWYYSSLNAVLQMADIVGDSDIYALKAREASIRENFQREFAKEEGYSSGSFYDDRANALTYLAGLVTEDMTDKVIKILNTIENSSPYMEYYVLEALCCAGHHSDALNRIKRRYKKMTESENSTLWEDFTFFGTKNHAWTGGPLTICYKYFAGITPLKPGFEEVAILPQPVGLDHISATVLTNKGFLKVKYQKLPDEYRMTVSLPENSNGMIGVPIGCLMGKEIQSILVNKEKRKGTMFGNHICFKVCGGEYTIVCS